jgi:hypothetical protein
VEVPSLHKIRRNAPRHHPTNPLATTNIIRNKTQQLGRCIRQCQYVSSFSSATDNLTQNRTTLIQHSISQSRRGRTVKHQMRQRLNILTTSRTRCARICSAATITTGTLMHTEVSHSNSHQQLNTTRWRTRTQKWPRPHETHGICMCRVHMHNVTAHKWNAVVIHKQFCQHQACSNLHAKKNMPAAEERSSEHFSTN